MPEGDTIHRSARTLATALEGRVVTGLATTVHQLRSREPERLVGQTVSAVEARGKHLLVWFAPGGLALHTHMGMTGSWHLYRPQERWRKPRHRARVTIAVPGRVAVCFSAPTCELLTPAEVARHRQLSALGPDAVTAGADLADARARLDARAAWPIGEALLDQRVLAGIGNVYRCEVLHLHAVNPWTPVGMLGAEVRDGLLGTAARLLRANTAAASPRRATSLDPGTNGRLAVYGRAGRPCRRCGTPVRVARAGPAARLVYWCPGCQPPGAGQSENDPVTSRAPADAGARDDGM